MEERPQQARHQANGLADDPGKGRHNDSVRGMECRHGSIPLRVLWPDHCNAALLAVTLSQMEPIALQLLTRALVSLVSVMSS